MKTGTTTFSTPRSYRILLGASLLALLISACGSTPRHRSRDDDDDDGAGGDSVLTTSASGGGGTTGTTTGTSTSTGSSSGAGGAGVGGGGEGGSGPSDPCADPVQQDIVEVDLGALDLEVAYDVPVCKNTLGFTVLGTAPSPSNVIGISRLRPPAGGSVILDFAMAGKSFQAFGRYGWIGGSNPQSDSVDAYPVQPGDWRVTLGSDGSITSAQANVWIRRTKDGQYHGGVVDVNVFVAPNAASKSYVDSVLSQMFPYAGMTLGDVAYYDLPSSFSVLDTQEEYRELLQQSAGVGTIPALNLFVIADFGADFGEAIGVAGGIPGSPMRHGTAMSGVAYQSSGNATYDASVLRHETGHLAGLFHTTEYAIDETDSLSDTPECPVNTMKSNPDGCPDVTNSMFPIAYGATKFTAAQEIVLHGSMLYRGILEAGGAPIPPKPVPPPPGAPQLAAFSQEAAGELALARLSSKPLRATTDPLERVLGSVWCGHGGTKYLELATRLAGDAGRLRLLALDEGAPEIVRSRALTAYVRASQGSPKALSAALDLASTTLTRERAGTRLRVAALRALSEHGGPRALAARNSASKTLDPVVRAVALDLSAPNGASENAGLSGNSP